MPKIYLEYDGKRYELVETRDCTKVCAFRTVDGHDYCETECHLPDWYGTLVRNMYTGFMSPKEIDDEQKA